MTEPIQWSDAPDRTSWGACMRVADIEIDKDHTLTLYCEEDQTTKVDAMFAEIKRLRAELDRLKEAIPAVLTHIDDIGARGYYSGKTLEEDAAIEVLRAAVKEAK
jgi:hypothetical protein